MTMTRRSRSLTDRDPARKSASYRWSAINAGLLAVFVYDLWHKCPGHTTWLHYVEAALAVVCCLSLLHHLRRGRARRPPAPAPARSPPASPRDPSPPRACLAPMPAPPSPATPPAPSSSPAARLSPPSPPPPASSYRAATVGGPVARPECDPEPARADSGLAEHVRALRLWLHLSVLRPLADRLEEAERRLARHRASLEDAGAERLRALAALEPALAETLPYLEALPERARGVRRLRELAADGGLSAYRWREDAELLARVVGVYADARLGAEWGARLGGEGRGRLPRVERAAGADAVGGGWVARVGAGAAVSWGGRDGLLLSWLVVLRACVREGAAERARLGPGGLNLLWVLGD